MKSISDTFKTIHAIISALPGEVKAALPWNDLVPDDPFQHDLIVIDDRQGDFPRIDLILAHYRWELEAIQEAQVMAGGSRDWSGICGCVEGFLSGKAL